MVGESEPMSDEVANKSFIQAPELPGDAFKLAAWTPIQ